MLGGFRNLFGVQKLLVLVRVDLPGGDYLYLLRLPPSRCQEGWFEQQTLLSWARGWGWAGASARARGPSLVPGGDPTPV